MNKIVYYLETNAVRILSPKLIIPGFHNHCYTSILSLCEILSGIVNESTFKERKGVLKNIYFSKILSDFDMPEVKFYKAYGINYQSDVSDSINLLGALCIASTSYCEFLREIEKKKLTTYWNFLKIYDENSNIIFKELLHLSQQIFDYSYPNLISKFTTRWDDLKSRGEILQELIVYFAERFLVPNSFIKIENKKLNDLIKSYDHSLDFSFLCIGYYIGKKKIFKNMPAKNDYSDLNHLNYLKNRNHIIVTNDKMLQGVMKKISPNNIMDVTNFESNRK